MAGVFRVFVTVVCLVSFAEAGRPLVVAHRGLLFHAPENTLANFRACLELRLGFEFDVERTKDGRLICLHDGTVDRTTNGTGKVGDLTFDDVRRLDAGSWFDPRFAGEKVPTVEEVLKLVAEYRDREVLIAVDLKAAGATEEIVRLAEQQQVLHRLLFIGRTISDPETRQQLRRAAEKTEIAAVANNPGEFASSLEDQTANWVYFRFLPTKEQLTAVHAAGKRAFIAGATVSGNVPENWTQATDAGIDAILTDYPLELSDKLRRGR